MHDIAEVDMTYGGGPFGKGGVTVVNATWRNINVTGAHQAGSFTCLKDKPCENLVLDHVVSDAKGDYTCKNAGGGGVASMPDPKCLSQQPPAPPPPAFLHV